MRLFLLGIFMITLAGIAVAFTHEFMQRGGTIAVMQNRFSLASSAFENGQSIPQKYACDGDGISPPLLIHNAPARTVSFALIVTDPDIPQVFKKQMKTDEYVHWVLFDIPAASTTIGENSTAGIEGSNDAGKLGYTPPCPPKEYEPSKHRYFFHVYALDSMLGLPAGAAKGEVMNAMQGHVVGQAELMGTYQKQ